MGIESLILSDLQARTQADAGLLALIEIGNDAGIATYYNTTDLPEDVPLYLETRTTKATLRQSLGDVDAGWLMAGLRSFAAGSDPSAPLVAEALIELDAGRPGPNLGNPAIRDIITGMGTANAFGDDSEAIAVKVLALAPRAKLCHKIAGGPIRHEQVSAALSSVRVNGTVELIEDWQTIEGGE